MVLKLPNGTVVDLIIGSEVTLGSPVFGEEFGVGPFPVVAFEGELPDLLIADPDKIAPVSLDQIVAVSNKPADKVEVTFPDGTVVLVDVSFAGVVQAIIDANAQLMKKLADILSGQELKDMQAKLDAMKVERDAAVAFADKIRGSLPAVEAAQASLSELVAILKG